MSTKFTKNLPKTLRDDLAERFESRFADHQDMRSFFATGRGGTADFCVTAVELADIIDAVSLALKHRTPYRVIGEGTGSILGDAGFPGLMIVNKTQGLTVVTQLSQAIVDSGMGIRPFINRAASVGLGGLEHFLGLPGSIGGAVATRSQGTGYPFWQFVKEICLLTVDDGEAKITNLPMNQALYEQLQVQMNEQHPNPVIILNCRVQLAKLPQEEIMSRLKAAKRELSPTIVGPAVGHCFQTTLAKSNFNLRQLTTLKKYRVRLTDKQREVFDVKDLVTAQEIKNFLMALDEEVAGISKIRLDRRIHFLGYWPDDETNSEPDA